MNRERTDMPSYTGTCVYQTCSGLRIIVYLVDFGCARYFDTKQKTGRQARYI